MGGERGAGGDEQAKGYRDVWRRPVVTLYRSWMLTLTVDAAGKWSATTTTPDGEVSRNVPVTSTSPVAVVAEAKRIIDRRIDRQQD
jgi:hypothetical protein